MCNEYEVFLATVTLVKWHFFMAALVLNTQHAPFALHMPACHPPLETMPEFVSVQIQGYCMQYIIVLY